MLVSGLHLSMSGVSIDAVVESMGGPGGERTVMRLNGNEDASLGIVLGKDLERQLDIEPGDGVYLDVDVESGTATIHFPEK